MADPIVEARRAAGSLSGGVGVREFAAREFPREDPAWIVSQSRPPRPTRASFAARWRRFRRLFDAPGETESAPEASLERKSLL